MNNVDNNIFLLGYTIGAALNISREEPWVLIENENTLKIIRTYSNNLQKPTVEVE
jgi:hypothetical protein